MNDKLEETDEEEKAEGAKTDAELQELLIFFVFLLLFSLLLLLYYYQPL